MLLCSYSAAWHRKNRFMWSFRSWSDLTVFDKRVYAMCGPEPRGGGGETGPLDTTLQHHKAIDFLAYSSHCFIEISQPKASILTDSLFSSFPRAHSFHLDLHICTC